MMEWELVSTASYVEVGAGLIATILGVLGIGIGIGLLVTNLWKGKGE